MQKPTLRFGELNIPIAIIEALQQDRLVVFVGAGVSMGAPTNLMNFEDLTQLIITGHKAQSPSSLSNQIQHLNIDADLKKQLIDATWKAQYRAPEERLGEAQDSGKIDIKAQCLHHLKDSDLEPNHLHHQIIRLFAHNPVRIITTNFERMLQKAAQLQNKTIKTTSIAPNLPQGDVVEGIVHLHGSLEDKESIILSDRDFGRAYLTEGWARRFITRVFSQYTVLFIGYSYNDTIMKYLARSTSQNTTQKLFGISSVTAENQEAEARRWELLGMTHIPYFVSQEHGHQALNTGIEALADCLNWSFSEQQAHIQQLVQDIEGRPENLSDTA
ncbi:SIR2 family protein [Vitreoscilla stercoraria]|uniref:SIR2 family protein n=1 Tax=Vitreoscilla stercoraria TaxID=61 RepID=A0ABY4EDA9_VITST|nr:SIR2 family protein [Vitreoscilla stercoraria]UOO93437.1 SIR2 family protein [Vitreoscilla stercoraria]